MRLAYRIDETLLTVIERLSDEIAKDTKNKIVALGI